MQQKRSRGVQQHEVSAAADALLATGARPTVERVRLHLGRGSPNTLAPMLEEWFGTLAPRLGISVPSRPAEGAPPAVRKAIDELWRTALSEARTEAAGDLGQELAALASERDELTRMRASVEVQIAAAAERERLLQESLVLARSQSDEAAGRAAQLQDKLDRAEGELASVRQTLSDLVQQHAAERRSYSEQLQNLAVETKVEKERAGSAERRLLAEVDRAREEAKRARRETLEVQRAQEREFAVHQEDSKVQSAKLHAAQIELASLRERLSGAERRVADLQRSLDGSSAAVKPRTRAAVAKSAKEPRKSSPTKRIA